MMIPKEPLSELTGALLTKEEESIQKLGDLLKIIDKAMDIQEEEGGDVFKILSSRFGITINYQINKG